MGDAGLANAVRASAAGTTLAVAVTPGAKVALFPDGFDPWRERIGVRVTAPAKDGKANRDILQAVATFFGLKANQVKIVAGEKASLKAVLLVGLAAEDALQRLREAMVPE